jgi:amino acid adenylation domain-containing protein
MKETGDTAMADSGCIHELIENRTRRHPDDEAFRWHDVRLTYRKLDEQANRLANLLRGYGVAAEDRIGVHLSRGPRLIVALLGILKTGGCYVGLDPAYPPARVRFLAEDAGTALILTERALPGSLTAAAGTTVTWEDLPLAACSAARPAAQVSPRNLAYLIYTSGSTGTPKGVMIEHRSVVAMLRWAGQCFTAAELGGVLAATSICFDLSVFEIFAPLAHGGRFVLVDNVLRLAGPDPVDDVQLINTVPSAMRELLAAGAIPASVQTVCLAGEPLTAELAALTWKLPQLRRLLNLYGPTEDTTYSTWATIGPDETDPLPIGRPLPCTDAHVLDDQGRRCAPGVVGELHLTGAGLARGYHNRPGATADRFRPDAIGDRPGLRSYRTGDRVRRRADGQLEFVGRTDDQVKLRGYRIELGEVTAAMEAVPGVLAAAATVGPSAAGTARLIGYATGAPNPALPALLARRLPAYMVPSEIVWLDRLPRTPSGKVDRGALPPPGTSGAAALPGPDALEDALIRAWTDTLGVAVGRSDDFFALGGDSLLALRLAGRLRATLSVPVTTATLLEHPTVARLSAHLRARPAPADDPGAIAAPATGALSPAQQRLWFLHQLDPADTSYLVSLIIHCHGPVDPQRLRTAVHAVIDADDGLRTAFLLEETGPVQRVLRGVTAPIEQQELPADADLDAELRYLAQADAARPFDLRRPPLLRCRLLTSAQRAVALIVTGHHIVLDGWSLALLTKRLAAAYEHPGVPLPSGPGPAYFADRQLAWLRAAAGRQAVTELASSLRGAPHLLAMPTDRPRPAVPGTAGRCLELPVGADLAKALRATAAAHGASPYMVGLAAFAVALQRWTDQDDLVIGTAFAGRGDPGSVETIGCFVNLLPVRLRPDPGRPFTSLLARTRRATLLVAVRQDVPLELLLDQLRIGRTLAHHPLIQVSFGVQSAPSLSHRAGDVLFAGAELQTQTARLDLTLWLEESPGGLLARWTYRTDLFRNRTIRDLHDRYIALLTNATSAPDTAVGDLLDAPSELMSHLRNSGGVRNFLA